MFAPFEGLAELIDPSRLAAEIVPGVAEPPPTPSLSPPVTRTPHTIKRMDPIEGEPPQFFLGVVREKLRDTDSIRNLYMAMGQIGLKTYDLPPKTRAIQITVVDTQGEPNESYTGVINGSLLDSGVEIGVMVGATFKPCVTPSAAIWLITEIIPI
jgi:hypothetical protein